MAVSEILGLFQTPDQYLAAQDAAMQQQFERRATLSPFQKASVLGQQAGYSAAQGIGGALGGKDPQLEMISRRNMLLSQLDPSDPDSYAKVAQVAAKMGDPQFAVLIAQEGRKAKKELEPPKLTGDERFIKILQTIESKYLNKQEPTAIELSTANMAMQMLSKPRSYFDAASGQMVTQAATDPSKAFPLTFAAMGASTEGGATTTPKPTVQQATGGNLPTTSQQEIADIEANLLKIKSAAPQLEKFSNLLKSGEVKFNAAANAFDFLGAVVPPIFGGAEVGNQVKKDEFTRAFTERVNFVLNNAKGVQARDDAKRAEQQIASPSTFYSSARMQGAIDYLKRAEVEYEKELQARKGSLQRQGKPETIEAPSAKPTETTPIPAPSQTPPASAKQPSSPAVLTREQKIQRFIDFNDGKPTRREAEEALRKAGKL
jgi:hypothetical protein